MMRADTAGQGTMRYSAVDNNYKIRNIQNFTDVTLYSFFKTIKIGVDQCVYLLREDKTYVIVHNRPTIILLPTTDSYSYINLASTWYSSVVNT